MDIHDLPTNFYDGISRTGLPWNSAVQKGVDDRRCSVLSSGRRWARSIWKRKKLIIFSSRHSIEPSMLIVLACTQRFKVGKSWAQIEIYKQIMPLLWDIFQHVSTSWIMNHSSPSWPTLNLSSYFVLLCYTDRTPAAAPTFFSSKQLNSKLCHGQLNRCYCTSRLAPIWPRTMCCSGEQFGSQPRRTNKWLF